MSIPERGDINDVIQSNKGLIYKQLHRFGMLNDQDAESFAYEALWHAAEDFDESKNIKFSTVATVYIYNALCGYLRTKNAKRKLDVVSYNAVLHLRDDDHEYIEVLESAINVEGDFITHERATYALTCLIDAVNDTKNDKHKKILSIWIDSDFTASATLIADHTSLSQSYVSQTIKNFRYKLIKLLEDKYDKGN